MGTLVKLKEEGMEKGKRNILVVKAREMTRENKELCPPIPPDLKSIRFGRNGHSSGMNINRLEQSKEYVRESENVRAREREGCGGGGFGGGILAEVVTVSQFPTHSLQPADTSYREEERKEKRSRGEEESTSSHLIPSRLALDIFSS